MKKNFWYSLSVLTLLFVLFVTNNAQAYQLYLGKYPSHLSSNLRWNVDKSVDDMNYKQYVVKALNWNSSPYYIVIGSEESTASRAQLRFYYDGEDRGKTVATNTNSYEGSTNYYNRSVIQLHLRFKNTSSANKNETIVHEVGHSLGLNHEDYSYSIMLSEGFIGTDHPTSDDWAGIKAKYQ